MGVDAIAVYTLIFKGNHNFEYQTIKKNLVVYTLIFKGNHNFTFENGALYRLYILSFLRGITTPHPNSKHSSQLYILLFLREIFWYFEKVFVILHCYLDQK